MMVGIQASNGLITGIPIQDTIDKLLAIAARPRTKVEDRVKDLKSQKLAIVELTTLVIGVELAAKRLGSTDLFNKTRVAASDDKVLAATATGNPIPGSYQYAPVRRAQAHQVMTDGFANKTDAIGAGDLTIRVGGFVDRSARLDELNAGAGVQRGQIKITDRSGSTATIDLRYATTVDDVLRAINDNSDIQVEATTAGDRIQLMDHTGQAVTNLRVQQVGTTTTAADLGLANINVAADAAIGEDVLRMYGGMALQRLNDGNGMSLRRDVADLRTSLRDGSVIDVDFLALKKGETESTGTSSAKNGVNGQIQITSTGTGSTFDGYKVELVDDNTITSGNEKVSFDAGSKVFTVKIDAGNTRAAEVVAKLNADPTFAGLFTASSAPGGNGTGVVDTQDTLTTSGGAIEYYNEKTLADLIATINRAEPSKLQARFSASGDAIELVDLTAGAGTFSVVSPFGGTVAEDLGFTNAAVDGVITGERQLAGLKTVLLSSLAGGFGLGDLGLLSITNRAGANAAVDLSAAETLEDIIESISGAGVGVVARVNSARNGIEISDTTGGTGNLVIASGDATNSAEKLNIQADVAKPSVDSGSLSLQTFNESQTLSSLRNGRGIGRGSFLITDSNGSVGAVNLTVLNAQTVGDVVRGINSLGLGVSARVNDSGDGLLLTDTAGGSGQLTVADAGSGSAAKDLKIAGTSVIRTVGGIPTKVIDGSYSLRVTLDANDNLQDLVTKINAVGAEFGASLINSGAGSTPYRMIINSQNTGAAGELQVDGLGLGIRFQETAAAQDALLLVGSVDAAVPGALIASSTNDFDDVIEGVRLTANAATTSPQTITIQKDVDSTVSQVKAFVEQYNKLRDKVGEVASFNAEERSTGILFGTHDILAIDSEFSSSLTSRFFAAGSIQSFGEVGISPDSQGKLQFDEERFRAKYSSNPSAVTQFFTQTGNGGAARIVAAAERLAGKENSSLINRSLALQKSIESSQRQIDTMNATLDRQREQMQKQFAHLEEVISRMQSSLTSIARIQPISYTSRSSN